MQKSEISRLINSFSAIKSYFDTTKQYMPQIAKLVIFIEEIVPLLNNIHENLHQSTSMIPTASEKLNKVTSATEMAATEVMDIVDKVINRLNTMSTSLDEIEQVIENNEDVSKIKDKTLSIRSEINGSQDDLFSIMNALQFQDITTQQINSISSTIESVHGKLAELLKGFSDDEIYVFSDEKAAFDPNAEFDFIRSAQSQKVADEYIKIKRKDVNSLKIKESNEILKENEEKEDKSSNNDIDDEVIYGEDGQPDVNSIINNLKTDKKKYEKK